MEKKKSNNKAKKQAEKNDNEALLEKVAQMLSKNFRHVIAIISLGNYIKICKAKDKCDCPRLTFCQILPLLRIDYYLQIQDFKVINMLFMVDESHVKDQWWIKLPNDLCYNISPDYRANFLYNLYFMYKYKAIRERNEKLCHKKLFSSKFEY